jgi:hypothetical protein
MKNIMSTGTSVTESSAAPAMAKVLVKASGLNSRPSWPSSVNTGRKETVMMSSEKNRAGPTSLQALIMASARALLPSPSRGGLGWGWVCTPFSPIPLPASPLKGEEKISTVLMRLLWLSTLPLTIDRSLIFPKH